MEIVQRSQRVQVERYGLDFEWNDTPGAGFSFPCDKDGNLKMDEIPETARENLQQCLNGSLPVKSEGVKDYSYSYFQAAIGRCICSRLVTLEDPLTNTCEGCQREYNSSGQLLAPRSQWEEIWSEEDPYKYWSIDSE